VRNWKVDRVEMVMDEWGEPVRFGLSGECIPV
jgi:hypothetical protein